jgi:tRNA(Ile)-lysidine synthase
MNKITADSVHQVLITECGLNPHSKLLLAVSGGMDSMVLLDVLVKSGFYCEVAHCNFKLRGEESDLDEQLVLRRCQNLGVKSHVKSFQTREFAASNKISIEMAARELRYNWFEELLHTQGLHGVLTAHHGDDAIETFFLNLSRGTGVRGLAGIKMVNGHVLRPFLNWSREALLKYSQENEIIYRHDKSNNDERFLRNKIRHQVIPVFKEMNPSFFETMKGNFNRLDEAQAIVEEEVHKLRDNFVVEEHGHLLIPISRIEEHTRPAILLFELLRPFGFNADVIAGILDSLKGIPGKQFYSATHRLIRDRYNLILLEKADKHESEMTINSDTEELFEPLHLVLRRFVKPELFAFSTNPRLIHLDADLVDFPLILRKWKQGDVFKPLGMDGFKKLSDFFVDQKWSIHQKEEAWILESGDDILWIVGHRIDDRYKITRQTKHVLSIEVKG